MIDVTVNNFDSLRNNYRLKVIISILLLIYFSPTNLWAQEAVTTAGGNASDSGGLISYSVGQVIYTTNTGSNGSGAQGVQQAYEISGIEIINPANFMKVAQIRSNESSFSETTNIEDDKFINPRYIIYPNPTSDMLTLDIEFVHIKKGNLSYQLLDINGKLLESKKVENSRTCISMANRTPASYLLNVVQGNKSIQTFKIVKN